jgi:hypothetical protein
MWLLHPYGNEEGWPLSAAGGLYRWAEEAVDQRRKRLGLEEAEVEGAEVLSETHALAHVLLRVLRRVAHETHVFARVWLPGLYASALGG